MKTLRIFGMVLMTVLVGMGFASCSNEDDDDNGGTGGKVSTSSVFTGGQPKSVAGMGMTYNRDGTLASITNGDNRVTFEYGSGARAVAANTVRMTIYDDGELFATYDFVLNQSGFATSCTETFNDDGFVQKWKFGYNSDGQLNYMTYTEGGAVSTNITYQNGNVVKTKTVSEEDPQDCYNYTIAYTDTINKGCVMLFEEILGVDLDEMEYAYYAGLLGRATKNLPRSSVYHSDYLDDDYSKETYVWTLNDSILPTKMQVIDDYGAGEEYTFSW